MLMTDTQKTFYAQTDLLISKFRQTVDNIVTLHNKCTSITIFNPKRKDADGLPLIMLQAEFRYHSYNDSISYSFITVDDKAVDRNCQVTMWHYWWDTVDRLLTQTMRKAESEESNE